MVAAGEPMAGRNGSGARLGDMKVRVQVRLKSGILDPQGKAIGNALATLGFSGIGEVRQGKLIELDLAETDPARACQQVEAMCKELLANPVTEEYAIEIAPSDS
jgi:phosphoribosylformylglycinamidine synthase subunit PurS